MRKPDLRSYLLLLICLLVPILSQGQINAKMDLTLKGKTLKEFFRVIEARTDYSFMYNNIDLNQKVDIDVKRMPLAHILQQVLAAKSLSYEVRNKQILIKNKPTGASPGRQNTLTITSRVLDAQGNPVIGANIVEKGTTNGTITDIDGAFSLTVGTGSVIVVSYIGFREREIIASDPHISSVVLAEDEEILEEVVVVGYGTQKKANLTGAVSSVSVQEMGKRQVGQTSLALQGLVPGLSIMQRSGQPGADGGIISIRGLTTLGNNDVLILVDGVELDINNVDASMIESVSVLKDAASAAIYGSRAANGVILITTKRAKEDNFQVSYSGYAGWQSAIDLPDMVNALDHMEMINLAYTNTGRSPLYLSDYIQEYQAGMSTDPDKYPDTDWVGKTVTNNGFMQNHFVTLSGGSKRIRTLVNIGYMDQNGIIENSNFKRYTFRMNTDMEFTKQFSARIDAHLLQNKRKEPSRNDAFHWMGRIPSNQPGILTNGQWGEGWNGDNPIAFTRDGGLKKTQAPSAILNFMLTYKPFEWLTVQGSYSPKYNEQHTSKFSKIVQTYLPDGTPHYKSPQKSTLTDETVKNMRNLLTASVTFDKTFGEHGLKILAGYQQDDLHTEGHKGYRENFPFPDYPVLDAGGEENQKSYGWAEEWALQSLFGRINYDYKGKYLFEANMRYDGSSRFTEGHRWGIFPSFSAGWRISEEKFWEPFRHIVDNFKIRGSWGQLGNQNIGNNYPFSSDIDLDTQYVFDKTVSSGAAITSLANSDITWETTTVTDIGIDLIFLGKINLTADYFHKETRDILLTLDVPLIIGMDAPQQNAGKVQNKGWDIGITYMDKAGDFHYRISANISDVRNKILDLKGIDETGLVVNREGEEMNSLYGLEAIGYIQPDDYDAKGKYTGATQYGNFGPGDIKYKDQNKDGVINTSDRVIIGTTIPRYTFGVTLYGEWKGIDLNLLFQGVGKANGYINDQGTQPFYMGGTVQEQHKDYWTPENRDARFPRLAFNETNNIQNSSFWMKNAAYVRLKNIQAGYSFPASLLRKTPLTHLRIYVSGDNLLTFDKFWKGFDVEAPVGNGGYYPQMKTLSFGLDVRF